MFMLLLSPVFICAEVRGRKAVAAAIADPWTLKVKKSLLVFMLDV